MAEMESPFRDATPEQHAEAIKAFSSSIRAEHMRLLDRFSQLLRMCNPLQMLAHFAFYDRALFNVQQGGSYKPLPQHAVEFFQGYFLTVPITELPIRITPPEVILELNEVLQGLSQTFPMLGFAIADSPADRRKTQLLAQSVRIHTHAIRNAGYYQQVMRQLKDVFGRLDESFVKVAGIQLSLLVTMCENIRELLEERLNRRMTTFHRARRCKAPRDVISTYCDGLALEPDLRAQLLEGCSALGLTADQALAMCNQDADRRLIENYIFTLDQFVAAYGDANPTALSAILAAWSYQPEGLAGFNRDYLFLDNPIWQRPIIGIRPPDYFWPSPELFHSFGIEMLEGLLRGHPELYASYQNRSRAEYLETRVADLCQSAFPTGNIWMNCRWRGTDGKSYETDVLMLLDSIALVIECKSARITPEARRGAPERLHREIRKLIEDSSRQSARFAELLLSNAGGVDIESPSGAHHIPAHQVRRVIRLNVTLDFFGPIACAVREMLDANLIDPAVATAPTMSVVDFENAFHLLETPLEKLHYLARRSEIERNVELFADEEDLLACYLATGMNLGEAEFGETRRFMISPMGNALQPYLMAFHSGQSVTKPRRRFTGWWRQLLHALEERAFLHWTLTGLVLLDVRHEDQQGFERMTRRMLKTVRSNWHSPGCLNSVVLANGPRDRRTAIVAIGVKRATREERSNTLQRAATIASEEAETEDIVAIGLDAEKTLWPYTVIAYSRLLAVPAATSR